MKLSPKEVQQQQFKVKFRGFDAREVDGFLERVADSYKEASDERDELKKEVRRLKLESQGYKEREESFKRAMLNSQKVVEQMKENAKKSAELTIAEAEVKAEKILNQAYNRLARIHDDIAELKRQRMQIEVQIRSILEAHTKLLEMGQAESKEMDESDSKVKLLQQKSS